MEPGRGRFLTLISVFFSIVVMGFLMAYGLYWASLNKSDRTVVSEAPSGQLPSENLYPESSSVDQIRRIRFSISRKLVGREPERFRMVFNELERAASENRIDKDRLANFASLLKNHLQDGRIDEDEIYELLDALELSIIPPLEAS